jgi:Uncharacterised protein family (UPF0158)
MSKYSDGLREAISQRRVAAYLSQNGIEVFCLQLAGSGLLQTGEVRNPSARPVVEQVIADLGERQWLGDEIMADWLTDAVAGTDVDGALPIDIGFLADTLESDFLEGGDLRVYLDLTTGEDVMAGEDQPEIDEEDMNLLYIPPNYYQGESWRDRVRFVAWVEDEDLAERLMDALQGRGAYRRFRTVLEDYPKLMARFWDLENDRQYCRAVRWLAMNNLRLSVGGSLKAM